MERDVSKKRTNPRSSACTSKVSCVHSVSGARSGLNKTAVM